MAETLTITKLYGKLQPGERFRTSGSVYADAVHGGGWHEVAHVAELIIGYDLDEPADVTSPTSKKSGVALPYNAMVEVLAA